MAESRAYQRGERVVHPRRPEWGTGIVNRVDLIQHEGKQAQRLTVDFEHQGRVAINTAVAELLKEHEAHRLRAPNEEPPSSGLYANTPDLPPMSGGWLGQISSSKYNVGLAGLPEIMTDPFSSLQLRLEATLESYRFTNDARSLISWAVVQSGLTDPLSKYTRHELEQAFEAFCIRRDSHLRDLVTAMKRKGEQRELNTFARNLKPGPAKTALQRALR